MWMRFPVEYVQKKKKRSAVAKILRNDGGGGSGGKWRIAVRECDSSDRRGRRRKKHG
jgi:hypothetical protein